MPQTSPTSIRRMQLFLLRKHFWASTLTLLYLLSLVDSSPFQRGVPGFQQAKHNEGNKLKSRPTKGKKPAAHFEADPFTTNALLWSKYMDNTVNQGKLSLRDNKIYIPSNGSYYIYTQASYHGKDCSKVGFDYLSHVVLHHFDEATPDRSLLSSQKTLCGGQSGNTSMPANSWRKSLFQGGIFELNKGDYIYTFTRGEDYLAREPGDTYIGLYAL